MSERIFRTSSAEETQALAGRLARELKARGPRSVLVGLDGELGAGKTAFVQGFVAALLEAEGRSPDEVRVASPTFAIAQTYSTHPTVTHMDLYRLATLADLEAIGYREHYFAEGVTLVEWASRVPAAIPVSWVEIHLAVLPSDVREIRVRAHGAELQSLPERLTG